MKIESVRAIKAEIYAEQKTKAFAARKAFRRAPTAHIRAFPMRASEIMVPLALGITGKKKRYKLAVRVQKPAPWLESTIDALKRRCRGEIDVRFIGLIHKQKPWHQNRNRPQCIGGSVSPTNLVIAGTLGCYVKKRGFVPTEDENEDMILSNNHVLADENRGRAGDAIVQQGRLDGGRANNDKVARLTKYVRLKRTGNIVDAAVAELDSGVDYYYNWLETLGEIKGVRQTPLDEGEIVYKVGRTTGVTKGIVSAIEMDDVVVGYDTGDKSFNEQIEIAPMDSNPFSLGGDSGSLIVDAKNRAVGLLFAGNDTSATYANPIQQVLDMLGVDLVY